MREYESIHVLVVDDSSTARQMIVALLSELGVQHDEAENGREAISLISENRYDLAFLDVVMPDTDGFEVLRWIGKQRHPIPVVVFSQGQFGASGSSSFARIAEEFGAVRGFQKPVTREKVIQAMEFVSGIRKSHGPADTV